MTFKINVGREKKMFFLKSATEKKTQKLAQKILKKISKKGNFLRKLELQKISEGHFPPQKLALQKFKNKELRKKMADFKKEEKKK